VLALPANPFWSAGHRIQGTPKALRDKALADTILASRPKRAGTNRPFFLVFPHTRVALQDIVAQTVAGLGYELVELERSAGGTLRVTIDFPWSGAGEEERFVNVEDCERVTRQLQYTLEVEEVDYKRLEVSSPGIDRPLRSQQDFERFAGEVVDITLKAPMGAAAAGQVAANRRKFRGTLEQSADGQGWQVVWTDEPAVPPGQKVSKKKREVHPLHVLGFTLDELKEARLAPIVDFKGRKRAGVQEQGK
jgi:ribosome maturation factor RimP